MYLVFLFNNFFCLRRATFVQSHKSSPKDSSKNFSVILSVCWFTNWIRRIVTSDSVGQLWHIFLSNFNAVWPWKIFGWRLFFVNKKGDGWANPCDKQIRSVCFDGYGIFKIWINANLLDIIFIWIFNVF